MDQCCLFHLTCAQGNGFYSPPIKHGGHPIWSSIIYEQTDAAFYEVNNWRKMNPKGEGEGEGVGERTEEIQGKKAETKRCFFSYRIVNHKPADQWRAGLLTLFCFHSSHFPSTFLSFSSAFSTSTMVTSFTVHSALYLPPPSQVSLLPWQQQTSEWII